LDGRAVLMAVWAAMRVVSLNAWCGGMLEPLLE
jgi:hypothetical protein